ncbi:hypothetical protein T4D_963 [Trichinella pseudospiralis]|uniref:Uncharacterized protein n=1 Tax=Trichinella pseudospiralis TaxID=6337 RepID=A0A0V1FXE8_TRIPS|nr:hypothetical protein T4D_963 [Trichinella pseudospiralis]
MLQFVDLASKVKFCCWRINFSRPIKMHWTWQRVNL